jgi:hypothetical protein
LKGNLLLAGAVAQHLAHGAFDLDHFFLGHASTFSSQGNA